MRTDSHTFARCEAVRIAQTFARIRTPPYRECDAASANPLRAASQPLGDVGECESEPAVDAPRQDPPTSETVPTGEVQS
jgi:hypothetical protein